jgi:hypothetical protein
MPATYTFVETKQFSRLITGYLSDDEYASLQRALIANPTAGVLIAGTGGVRVIYYVKLREGVIWMLTIYGKNVAENIPAHILRKIKEELNA